MKPNISLPTPSAPRPEPASKARPNLLSKVLAERTGWLREVSAAPFQELLERLQATRAGLPEATARLRLEEVGRNEVAYHRPPTWYGQLGRAFLNPFILVLVVLAAIELWSNPEEVKGPLIISVMVALSVGVRFVIHLPAVRCPGTPEGVPSSASTGSSS